MFNHTHIYTIHENLSAADDADRIELVREGFAFWAMAFGALWLLAHRLWLPALGYFIVLVLLNHVGTFYDMSPAALGMLQLGLQFWLGCNAYDIQRWMLENRGYAMRGVVCAESEMLAQQRAMEAQCA